MLTCLCTAYGCLLCPSTNCIAHTIYTISYLALYRKDNPQRRAFQLTKHVENHSHFPPTVKVSWPWVGEGEINICPRRAVGSWLGGVWADQLQCLHLPRTEGAQPPKICCHSSPFTPPLSHLLPQLSHLSPSESSPTSCQEHDLLKPAWWRLQLQKGWYLYLDPASCLLAGGFYLLVFGFVVSDTDSLPSHIRTETSASSQDILPATRPTYPGPLSSVLSPPAAQSPVISRCPSSACSGAETRVAGWARGNRSISAPKNGKIHSYQRGAGWVRQEGGKFAGFPGLLEPTVLSKAWLSEEDQGSGWGAGLSMGLRIRLLGMPQPSDLESIC